MTENTENTIGSDFEQFTKLDYCSKLIFYNARFGIVPFAFPPFDSEVSWYWDRVKLSMLTNFYFLELRGSKMYEKSFVSNGEKLLFSIKPLTFVQRIQYNKFIQLIFLHQKDELENIFRNRFADAHCSPQYIKAEVNRVSKSINWVTYTVRNFKGKPQLADQFLGVYYNGIKASGEGRISLVRCRRKFVELYLYSQGILLAGYLQFLQQVESANNKSYTGKPPVQIIK